MLFKSPSEDSLAKEFCEYIRTEVTNPDIPYLQASASAHTSKVSTSKSGLDSIVGPFPPPRMRSVGCEKTQF